MSIITHKRAIVPSLWPGGLGRPDTGGFDAQVNDSWRYVPESFEGICDWAMLSMDGDEDVFNLGGRRELIYRALVLPHNMRGRLVTVTIILQGFLGNFNISVLGNWNKRDKAAVSATQYLMLESGGDRDTFGAQVRALKDLRSFISAKAGVEQNEDGLTEDTIRLERPVFTKVRAVGEQAPAIRMSHVSDPGGKAQKISAQWRVDHVIRTGARRDNGQNMAIAHTAFRRGDFVQVSVFADVRVVRRRNRIVGTNIRFGMKEVVKLWGAADAKHIMAASGFAGMITPTLVPGQIVEMPSGFEIGQGEEQDVAMVSE